MRPLARSAFPLLALLAACSKGDTTAPDTGRLQVNDHRPRRPRPRSSRSADRPATRAARHRERARSATSTPGVYTINASKVTANGSTYTPSPARPRSTSSAGTTPTIVDVAYGVSTRRDRPHRDRPPARDERQRHDHRPVATIRHVVASVADTLTNLAPGRVHDRRGQRHEQRPISTTRRRSRQHGHRHRLDDADAGDGHLRRLGGTQSLHRRHVRHAGDADLHRHRAAREGPRRVPARLRPREPRRTRRRRRCASAGTMAAPRRSAPTRSSRRAAAVPTTIDQGTLTNSWNLHVPGIADPAGPLDPRRRRSAATRSPKRTRATTASRSRGTPQALTVHTENPFNVTLVPVRTKVDGLTGNVSAGNAESFMGFLQRIHPVPSAQHHRARDLHHHGLDARAAVE